MNADSSEYTRMKKLRLQLNDLNGVDPLKFRAKRPDIVFQKPFSFNVTNFTPASSTHSVAAAQFFGLKRRGLQNS